MKPINQMTLAELAAYAVTLPNWRWMRGMIDSYQDLITADICHGYWADTDVLPDLNEPATLGCVLAMVRKKWAYLVIECRLVSDMPDEPNSRPYYRAVSPFASESWIVHTDWMTTEAHALIAALAKERV